MNKHGAVKNFSIPLCYNGERGKKKLAAVEKRKNIFVGLLINHIMLAVISTFIIMPITGTAKYIFGVFMSIIYYIGIYDFSLKEGAYHKKPYTEMEPSYKYPFIYGCISSLYIWLPVFGLLIKDSIPTRLFYLIWDSVFSYTNLYSLGENLCKFGPLSAIILTILNFGFSYLGYYHAMRDTSIAKLINKYIYKGNPPKKKKK